MNFAFIKRKLQSLNWPPRRRDPRLALGLRGERAAARYLKRRERHRIITRNYRCVAGEIDLISLDGGTIVFVEVKTRSSDATQDVQEAVRSDKWARIERAARCFLSGRRADQRAYRFDLVTVLYPPRRTPIIEHFVDAYQSRYP